MNKDMLAIDMYDRLNNEDKEFVNFLKLKGLELGAFQLLCMYPYINRQLGNTTVNVIKLLKELLILKPDEEVFSIEFQRGGSFTYIYINDIFVSSFSDKGSMKWLNSYVREIVDTYFKEELIITSVSNDSIKIKRI